MQATAQKPEASDLSRPSAEALSVFFRSMAVMFNSAVNINHALELMSRQSDDARMAAIAADLSQRVYRGAALSQAMSFHPEAFSNIQVRMMQIGERTGTLYAILARLATYEEKRRAVTMKVKSALTYPLFLFGLATLMLVILPPFMFEGIFTVISNSGVEPPFITMVVVTISEFIRSPVFWVLLVIGLFTLVALGPRLVRQPEVERRLYALGLSLPVLGRALRMVAVSRFARALELQLDVGENPMRSLDLAARASGNPLLLDRIDLAVGSLRDGMTLTESLERTDFFPRAFLHMLMAAEETAEVSGMMGRLADVYDSEVEQSLDTFTSLLEPLVMLVMGIVVGVVVVATMLPMMKLLQTL